jgi:hypothetical protein
VSIGPVFEIPITAMSQLPKAVAMKGIQLKRLEDSEQPVFRHSYMLSARLGRIHCRWREFGETSQLWLTFPRGHAFNLLAWPFDFYLSRQVEQALKQLGARRIRWSLDTGGN